MRSLHKRIATILALLMFTLALSSCSREKFNSFLSEATLGLWDALLLDEETHNIVAFVDENTLEYQGHTYYLAPMIFLEENETTIVADKGYEYIGWSGPRFFYIDTYYGDSKDSPNILYAIRLGYTYFKDDYDYKADTFRLEGTEDTICFGDALTEKPEMTAPFSTQATICLSSSTHASLDIRLDIFSENGVWYASSMDLVCFELSEDFVEILVKNQIISE